MAAAATRRRELDIAKLTRAGFEVVRPAEGSAEFFVVMRGPAGSSYDGGRWVLYFYLPKDYPFKSPSVGFRNKIWHPNIDWASGSICLDVLNTRWTPMYDLLNVVDVLLPQLLSYPNPADPLNPEAALMYSREPERFRAHVRELVATVADEASVRRVLEAEVGDLLAWSRGGSVGRAGVWTGETSQSGGTGGGGGGGGKEGGKEGGQGGEGGKEGGQGGGGGKEGGGKGAGKEGGGKEGGGKGAGKEGGAAVGSVRACEDDDRGRAEEEEGEEEEEVQTEGDSRWTEGLRDAFVVALDETTEEEAAFVDDGEVSVLSDL